MLQIDHIYEFLYTNLFKDFRCQHFIGGVIDPYNMQVFTPSKTNRLKLFFNDQEPFFPSLLDSCVEVFDIKTPSKILVTSEYSQEVNNYLIPNKLYYFFHGFAALDWYRGYYTLNHNKDVFKEYEHDYISFNLSLIHISEPTRPY